VALFITADEHRISRNANHSQMDSGMAARAITEQFDFESQQEPDCSYRDHEKSWEHCVNERIRATTHWSIRCVRERERKSKEFIKLVRAGRREAVADPWLSKDVLAVTVGFQFLAK